MDLQRIRASAGVTYERSYHPALQTLLKHRGQAPAPAGVQRGCAAQQGSGHPDLGLHAAGQVQKGRHKQGQSPECAVLEVKLVGDDSWLSQDSTKAARYREHYWLVLVTNIRGLVLLGGDAEGQPAKLETVGLAESAGDFETKLQYRRSFAMNTGPALAEYPGRAPAHCASLVALGTWRCCWHSTPGTGCPSCSRRGWGTPEGGPHGPGGGLGREVRGDTRGARLPYAYRWPHRSRGTLMDTE